MIYPLFLWFFQTNVIEAGSDMKRESEKEWYYGNKDKERLGPYSYEEVKTNIWAGSWVLILFVQNHPINTYADISIGLEV